MRGKSVVDVAVVKVVAFELLLNFQWMITQKAKYAV